MDTQTVQLIVSGCDDETAVFFELTAEQVELLEAIANRVTDAGGGCMPIMHVERE